MAQSCIAPEGCPLVLVPGLGSPVAVSISIATTFALVQLPAAPWSATIAWSFQGDGQLAGEKSTENGVSPIRKESVSRETVEQSGVGCTSVYGRSLDAQQGNPRSSPCRMGTIFSRPLV